MESVSLGLEGAGVDKYLMSVVDGDSLDVWWTPSDSEDPTGF